MCHNPGRTADLQGRWLPCRATAHGARSRAPCHARAPRWCWVRRARAKATIRPSFQWARSVGRRTAVGCTKTWSSSTKLVDRPFVAKSYRQTRVARVRCAGNILESMMRAEQILAMCRGMATLLENRGGTTKSNKYYVRCPWGSFAL